MPISQSQCQIICGDNRDVLKQFSNCFDLIMTSPPYADARKSHYDSVEPENYHEWLATFHSVFWQALKPTGSLILNIKDRIVDGTRCHYVWKAIDQLERLGWYCIDDYVWNKPNPYPGRWPTRLKDGWEYCFHLSPTKKPYFNADAVRVHDKGSLKKFKLKSIDYQYTASKTGSGFYYKRANFSGKTMALPSNVVMISSVTYNTGHPAAFPVGLPEFFIKLLTPEKGLVLDPFAGSGATAIAAAKCGRNSVLIDNQYKYCQSAYHHLKKTTPELMILMKDKVSANHVL
jgi:site-specific DNA-methyltransferase (adenine-specific)